MSSCYVHENYSSLNLIVIILGRDIGAAGVIAVSFTRF